MTDPLDEALKQLAAPEMPRRELVRSRARSALNPRPVQHRRRLYRRVVEPAMVATVCGLQLVWLFTTVSALLK